MVSSQEVRLSDDRWRQRLRGSLGGAALPAIANTHIETFAAWRPSCTEPSRINRSAETWHSQSGGPSVRPIEADGLDVVDAVSKDGRHGETPSLRQPYRPLRPSHSAAALQEHPVPLELPPQWIEGLSLA